MSGARWLFTGGGAIDLVLLVMAIELVWLTRAGRDPRAVLAALLPGACLALALRAALAGVEWAWAALFLALSLPLHLIDLHARGWLIQRNARSSRGVRSSAIADRAGSARRGRGP